MRKENNMFNMNNFMGSLNGGKLNGFDLMVMDEEFQTQQRERKLRDVFDAWVAAGADEDTFEGFMEEWCGDLTQGDIAFLNELLNSIS